MPADFDFSEEKLSPSDKEYEQKLRPLVFKDFSGQFKIIENLKIFVQAAKLLKQRF